MAIRKYKNKKGTVYEVRIKYKDNYNKIRYYQKRGFKTLREARNHEAYKNIELKEKRATTQKKTVSEVFYEFIDSNTRLAISTINIKRGKYKKYLENTLGTAYIKDVNYKMIRDTINSLDATNNVLSALNTIIKDIFNYAYNMQYIDRMPFAKLETKPKTTQQKNKIITDEMLDDLFKYCDSAKNGALCKLAFNIAWYTGLRLGEILALTWNDIDFNNDTIKINKSLMWDTYKKEIVIKEAKNEASVAVIPLALPLKNILAKENKTSDIVITLDGGYVQPHIIKVFLARYSNTHEHINFHMFRHTYTTKLFNSGVDVKTAQTLLRHKTFNTTMTIYTHLEENKLKSIVNSVFS